MKTKGNLIFTGIFNGIFAATLFLQLVCALLWSFGNLMDYKNFAQSENIYAALSSYPHILPVLYLLQIAVCAVFYYLASAAFLRAFLGDKIPAVYALLITVGIMTNPYVWMMHFTLLPDSIGLSMSLLVMAYAFLFAKKAGEKKDLIYLLMSMIWFVVLGLFFKKYFMAALPAVCFMGILALVKLIVRDRNHPQEADQSRMGFSAIYAVGMIFVPLLLAAVTYIRLAKGTGSIEDGVAPGWMNLLFRLRLSGMSQDSFPGVSSFLKGFIKEWVAGILSPWILALRTYPWGDSVNPFYISILWQKAPKLTEVYLRCASAGYALMISAALLKGFGNLFFKKKEDVKTTAVNIAATAVCIIFPAFVNVLLCIPEFDFRNAMTAYIFWAVVAAAVMIQKKTLEREDE